MMTTVILVSLLSLLIFVIMAIIIRGNSFEGAGITADAGKQVAAAANYGKWRWPSEMHKFAYDKSRMKDMGVLMLVLMQKILRDKTSFFPVLMISNLANSVSSVLIYLISIELWSKEIGIILFLLYIFCFWPYQIVLHGGYHVIAQMFALISIYFLMQINNSANVLNLIWFFFAGFSFCIMIFSSASSRKYVPIVFAAFIYSTILFFSQVKENQTIFLAPHNPIYLTSIAFIVISLSVLILVKVQYKQIVKAIYYEKGPQWMNSIIKNREKDTLTDKYNIAQIFIDKIYFKAVFSCLFLLVWLGLFPVEVKFIFLLSAIICGFLTSLILFTYPNFVDAIRGYYTYSDMKNAGHFNCVKDYFMKIGERFVDGQRAEKSGWRWLVRFFPNMVPFHIALCLGGFLVVSIKFYQSDTLLLGSISVVAIQLVSFSSIIIGEITRSPQIARTYFPSFIGILFWIGFSLSSFYSIIEPVNHSSFFHLLLLYVIISSMWNMWVLFNDIFPSRMVVARLKRKLDELRINQFYSYDTRFNHWLVDVLLFENPGKFEVLYIKSLADVKNGYVVVPGTSWKAVNVVGIADGVTSDDFKKDPILNHLIDSKKISKYSIASFKNMGTSRWWVHEDEVSSYRELILKDISEYDRWRARAWLLDVSRLRAEYSFKSEVE